METISASYCPTKKCTRICSCSFYITTINFLKYPSHSIRYNSAPVLQTPFPVSTSETCITDYAPSLYYIPANLLPRANISHVLMLLFCHLHRLFFTSIVYLPSLHFLCYHWVLSLSQAGYCLIYPPKSHSSKRVTISVLLVSTAVFHATSYLTSQQNLKYIGYSLFLKHFLPMPENYAHFFFIFSSI